MQDTACFTFHQGHSPLLISMPHNGALIEDAIAEKMTTKARDSVDTDWYLDKLYDFAPALGCSVLAANYSRYVIDLNRSADGKQLYVGADNTELCPTTSFAREPLYQALSNQEPSTEYPDEQEIERRVALYWQPYHQQLQLALNTIKAKFGYAILLEAHSIASRVPRFFEGQLPDFNFGTNGGYSCPETLIGSIMSLDYAPYSMVRDARFKGGYITRHYGVPKRQQFAIQLELSQATYMDEQQLSYDQAKASAVKVKLKMMVKQLLAFHH
jgi:N-formylglutamate deformylase